MGRTSSLLLLSSLHRNWSSTFKAWQAFSKHETEMISQKYQHNFNFVLKRFHWSKSQTYQKRNCNIKYVSFSKNHFSVIGHFSQSRVERKLSHLNYVVIADSHQCCAAEILWVMHVFLNFSMKRHLLAMTPPSIPGDKFCGNWK